MDGIKVMRERDIGSARSHQRIVGIAAQAFCYLFLIFMALVVPSSLSPSMPGRRPP